MNLETKVDLVTIGIAVVIAILVVAFTGGCASYKDGGTSLVVGEQQLLPEITSPDAECAIRIYESIKGARVWSRANHATRVEYETASTNWTFGLRTSADWMKLKVEVEPCEDEVVGDE